MAPVTEVNEKYVATMIVEKWIEMGYDDATILRKWNGGDGRIKSGYNKYGVWYDTEAYAKKGLAYLRE